MKATAEMLNALRARAGSDGKAAALLGVSQVTYSRWRSANTPDLPSDDNALKIAELLKLDPAYVLAVVNGDRSRTKETRAAWRRVAQAFGKAAALAVVSATPFLAAPGFNTSGNAPTSGGAPTANYLNTQCATRRRRSGWRAAVAALSVSLAGCASAPYWERTWEGALTVDVRYVDVIAGGGEWENVNGWASCDKAKRHCTIYLKTDAPMPKCTEQHERKHAAGFDHPNYRYNLACSGR